MRGATLSGMERAKLSAFLNSRPRGAFLQVLFFEKGNRRAALSVYEHQMVVDGWADPDYSQHLDWNDPDIKIAGTTEEGREQFGILEACSRLFEKGWRPMESRSMDPEEIARRDAEESAEAARRYKAFWEREATRSPEEKRDRELKNLRSLYRFHAKNCEKGGRRDLAARWWTRLRKTYPKKAKSNEPTLF